MNMQLYKTEDQNYLLDFQNLATKKGEPKEASAFLDDLEEEDDQPTTHALEFFELCSTFIAVRLLSSSSTHTQPLQELGR
jgi:hypothetical protein